MVDQAKKNFILSLKRFKCFYNQIKEYEEGIEKKAEVQQVSLDELNEKLHPIS